MKKRGMGLIEYGLILAMVVIVTIAFWGKISDTTKYLASLSSTKGNAYTLPGNPSPGDPSPGTPPADETAVLIQTITTLINGLDINSPNYIQKRIETAGELGKLLAKGATDRAIALLKEFAKKDGKQLSDNDAKACAASMSSCETLMTVSDFSWTTPVAMSSVYNGGKITVSLKYTYSYVNNNGTLVSATLNQGAYIQKEQNASSSGKTYGSFLNNYMDKKFSKSNFTGSATNVQTKIDSYMDEKNCELSKSDSQYVSFANHSSTKR